MIIEYKRKPCLVLRQKNIEQHTIVDFIYYYEVLCENKIFVLVIDNEYFRKVKTSHCSNFDTIETLHRQWKNGFYSNFSFETYIYHRNLGELSSMIRNGTT